MHITYIVHYFVNFTYYALFFIFYIYSCNHFAARIDDGDEMDDWTTTDYRTGNSRPLQPGRWSQDNAESAPIFSTSDFAGIRINIWNRIKFRYFLTLSSWWLT